MLPKNPLALYKICNKIFEHGFDLPPLPPPFWTILKKTALLVRDVFPNNHDYLRFYRISHFELHGTTLLVKGEKSEVEVAWELRIISWEKILCFFIVIKIDTWYKYHQISEVEVARELRIISTFWSRYDFRGGPG